MSGGGENPICHGAGAYVLGVLPDADTPRFTDHLSTCCGCQTQVGELVGLLPLLELLDRVSVIGSEMVDQDGEGPSRGAEPAEARGAGRGRRYGWQSLGRRQIRWAGAGLLAAALIGSVFALTPSRSVSSNQPVAKTSTAAAAALIRTFPGLGRASVQVRVSAADLGSTLTVLCSGELDRSAAADPGTRLVSLWVLTRSGNHIEVTAWTDMQGSTTIAGRSTVAPVDIVMLELRGATGQRLSQVAV